MANYDKVILRGIELDALYKGDTKIYPIEASTIYYKTSDGSLMNFTQSRNTESPYIGSSNGFTQDGHYLSIISNTYSQGQGVLTLQGVVNKVGCLICPTGAFISGDLIRPKVTEITFPNTITTLDRYAFFYLTNLDSVTLPDSVTNVNNYFLDSSSITSLKMKSTTAPIISNSKFQNAPKGLTLYYPKGSDYSTWITAANGLNWTFVEYETEGSSSSEELEAEEW
jgi:hypothetical protein